MINDGLELFSVKDDILLARESSIIDTGISCTTTPNSYIRLVKSANNLLDITTGTINSDYTDEIRVQVHNSSPIPLIIRKGDAIGHILLESSNHIQEPHQAEDVKIHTNEHATCIDPEDCEQIERILKEMHDTTTAGHPGIKATLHKVKRNYVWTNMTKDVETYVKGCTRCQQTKPNHAKHQAPLIPLE